MKAFFDIIRKNFGKLSQDQVIWIESLVRAANGLSDRHIAYVLATAWHETGCFKYTQEIWGPTAQQKKYEPPHAKAVELGNTTKGDGYRFRGRGPSQLTGKANYTKASIEVGVYLLANPDLASRPDYGSKIIVSGMREGWFTGKRMSDYVGFQEMRHVVNGTDKALMIANYASKFLEAVVALPPVPDPVTSPEKIDAPAPVSEAPKPKGFWAAIWAWFKRN